MSPERQDELAAMLEKVFALPAVRELEPERRLLRIHHDWLEAGELTQRTVARVSGQLRRYLDDQAWLENKRIMHLIRQIEHHALELRDVATADLIMEIDDPTPTVELPLERPLFSPSHKARISDEVVREGDEDVPADALYDQVHVDKVILQTRIRKMLQTRAQVSLAELLEVHPLEQGMAEVVAYMSLAADDSAKAAIDDARKQTVVWNDGTRARQATIPLVIFTR
jgi:hypothetical protein